jgi:3-isopropylmalate dehydrogenase
MLLRHSLGRERAARAVERAVRRAVAAGYRTADIAGVGGASGLVVSTVEMGEHVAALIQGEE